MRKYLCFNLLFTLFIIGCKKADDKEVVPFSQLGIEREGIKLYLASTAFDTIKKFRLIAKANNNISNSEKKYFEGYLVSSGDTIKVKARLKGDHTDHLSDNRWSFRIKSKSSKIWGHNKFSVQAIHTRQYLNEWIFHQLLKRENVLHLDYTYIPFSVNDTLTGYYAFESHFTQKILLNNNCALGPMLGFDESFYFNGSFYKSEPERERLIMECSDIKEYNKQWVKKSNNNKRLSDIAKSKVDSFRLGLVSPKQVLDISKWAKYIAISELMGYYHNLHWHNLKFYFNPETRLLEPIGSDLDASFDNGNVWSLEAKKEVIHKYLFSSKELINKVGKNLCKISNQDYWEDFESDYIDELEKFEKVIQKENSKYKFEPDAFYYSSLRIKKGLEKFNVDCP